MTRINIPLDPEIVPPDLPTGADTKLIQFQYYLEQLGLAVASAKGIKLTVGSAAEAKGLRMKFYRARQYVSRQGITSFDRLSLLIDGNSLIIKKDLPPEIELL